MHIDQRAALLVFAALLGRALAWLRNGDAAFFGYGAHRFRKWRFFQLHDKTENVAAFAATEAVVHLFDWADAERRSFFLVEGAEAGEILAAFFEAHVFADDPDDVRLLLDAIRE